MYFDLKGLIEEQVEQLKEENPKVKKRVEMAGKKEELDECIKDWEKELKLFLDADINKSILIGLYDTKEEKKEKWTIVRYLPKKSVEGVQEMQIWKENESIRKIVVKTGKANVLYDTEKTLVLELENEKLSQYSIQCSQKICVSSPDYYNVVGYIQPTSKP
ncbi:MAG: hypothetical protein OHK0038_19080 [Flammeovirgaceae bacterium]